MRDSVVRELACLVFGTMMGFCCGLLLGLALVAIS